MPRLENTREERFATYYAMSDVGNESAIKAGYSPKGAAQRACELLSRDHVITRIAEIRDHQWRRMHMSADEVLARVAAVARFDLGQCVDEAGNPLPIKDLPPEARMAISGMDVEERVVSSPDGEESTVIVSRTKKLRTSDRNKALEMLMRHKGQFEMDHKSGADAQAEAFAGVLGALVGNRNGLGSRSLPHQDGAITKAS